MIPVPACHVDKLQREFDRTNRRMMNAGLPPIVLVLGRSYLDTVKLGQRANAREVLIPVTEVAIDVPEGEIAKLSRTNIDRLQKLIEGLADPKSFKVAMISARAEDVLAATAAVIEARGWLTKSDAAERGGRATADEVYDQVFSKSARPIEITDTHRETARAVLDWAENVQGRRESLDTFNRNIVASISSGLVSAKYVGRAAFAVRAYMQWKAQQDAKVKYAGSRYLFEPGAKVEIAVTLVDEFAYWDKWRKCIQYLHRLVDDDGNVMIWRKRNPPRSLSSEGRMGTRFVVHGNVRKHDERDGIKHTELNRLNLEDEMPSEERAQETRSVVDEFGREVGRAVRLRGGWKAMRRVTADGYEFVDGGLGSAEDAVRALTVVVKRGALTLGDEPC